MKTITYSKDINAKFTLNVNKTAVLVEFKSGKAVVEDNIAEMLVRCNPEIKISTSVPAETIVPAGTGAPSDSIVPGSDAQNNDIKNSDTQKDNIAKDGMSGQPATLPQHDTGHEKEKTEETNAAESDTEKNKVPPGDKEQKESASQDAKTDAKSSVKASALKNSSTKKNQSKKTHK